MWTDELLTMGCSAEATSTITILLGRFLFHANTKGEAQPPAKNL